MTLMTYRVGKEKVTELKPNGNEVVELTDIRTADFVRATEELIGNKIQLIGVRECCDDSADVDFVSTK